MKTVLTLVDPSDLDLDMAFAEYIAGYEIKLAPKKDCQYWSHQKGSDYWYAGRRYLTSVDSVLPYLEAASYYASFRFYAHGETPGYLVSLWENDENGAQIGEHVNDVSLARAMVIALLRAKGVEITFS